MTKFNKEIDETIYEELLTTNQTAKILGLKAKTLEAKRRIGDGPTFVKLSERCVRYRPSDLSDFIESRLRKNTSQQEVS